MKNTMEFISNEIIKNLINDMENDKNFMANFIISDFDEMNLYFSNVDEIKKQLWDGVTGCDKSDYDDVINYFVNGLKSYDKLFGDENFEKTMFSIYIPNDNDDNFVFLNSLYNGENKIIIYYSQGGMDNIDYYDEIDITNITNYDTLLNVIKNKIIELY